MIDFSKCEFELDTGSQEYKLIPIEKMPDGKYLLASISFDRTGKARAIGIGSLDDMIQWNNDMERG